MRAACILYLVQYQTEQIIYMRAAKGIKVKVNAFFHRLHINKNIRFQTHIQWKRRKFEFKADQNKVETKQVNHQHGYSIFDQMLTLEFNLTYDEDKGQYEDKNTEIVVVITHEGKIKSGGYAKYNISHVLNNSLDGKRLTIPLTQCPDPNANVQVTFTCSSDQETFSEASSILNVSSRDFNMSRIDFHDDKFSLQMDRINETITKLGKLAETMKTKEKNTVQKVPQLLKRVQQLEGQNQFLKANVKKLEQKLAQAEKLEKEKEKKLQKTVTDLEKQLQKKDKNIKSRQLIQLESQKKLKEQLSKKEKQVQRYKRQLQEAELQIQKLQKTPLRTSLTGFGKMQIGDVNEIANFDSGKESEKQLLKEVAELRSQNNALQGNVASMSYKLAQLFNASYEYGGARLLDFLQTAIGLTEL